MNRLAEPSSRTPSNRAGRAQPLVLLTLVVGTLLSAGLFALATRLEQERERSALDRAGRARSTAVQMALEEYLQILRAMEALWNASDVVKRDEFERFVRPMLNRRTAPLRALEFVAVVPRDKTEEFVSEQRKAVTTYEIHGVNPNAPEEGTDSARLYPVQYVEPLSRNESALGLDLGSEAVRRAGLLAAENYGDVRSTEPVHLYQEPGVEGLILALPVYHPTSLLEKGSTTPLAGFVVAVLEIDSALRAMVSVLETEDATLYVTIDSGGHQVHSVALDLSAQRVDPLEEVAAHQVRPIESFEFAGLTWGIQFEGGRSFGDARPGGFAWMLLLGGLSLTSLLAAVINLRENRAHELLTSNRKLADSQVEREQAHAALRSSEERLRMFFDGNTSAMLLVDRDSAQIVDVNPAAEAFWGHSRSELRGMRISDLQPAGSSAEGAPHGHAPGGAQVVVHRVAGGALRTVEIHSSPIEVQGRQLLFSIVHDVSDREAMQRKLLASQKMESLGVLAGGIAHDFNNLLTSVIGNAELAQHLLPAGSPARAHVELSLGASSRAAELTRRLLAYAGKGSYERGLVDLGDEVREAIERVRPGAPPGIAIELQLAERLPKVEGDRLQLQQVVMNLALNAIEACKEGQGRVRIRTALAAEPPRDGQAAHSADASGDGPQVLIEVFDDGCGMDEAMRSRIFDPFFSTKFTGRGLGLPAVLGIVRAHRGMLSVESAPLSGSTFRIWLPAASGATSSVRRELERPRGRILVVDDEPTVREVLVGLLGALGYQVDCAASGEEALERCRAGYELVILDVTMPGMGGRAALGGLRQRAPELAVLLTSGYDEQEALRSFGKEAPDGFLQKPFTARALAAQVEAVLARRRGAVEPTDSAQH
jgi:PAS domain S-box-containing protein